MKNLILLLALASSSVLATTPPPAPEPAPSATAASDADAKAAASSQSTAGAAAGATAGAQANGDQAVTINHARSAPALVTAQTNTTAECTRAIGGGITLPGGGIGIGGALRDKDCRLNKAADAELARGNRYAAAHLRCKISFYIETFGKDCIAYVEPPVTVVPQVTHEDLEAVERRSAERLDRAFRERTGK